MDEILDIMLFKNKTTSSFTPNDIREIINIIARMYNVSIDGTFFSKKYKSLMHYDSDSNMIVVNYGKILQINPLIYRNYYILFLIAHEIRHAVQYSYSLGSDDVVSKIYLDCFDYIGKKTILSNIFYASNHDDFPIEINADLTAFIFVIYVAFKLDDINYYKRFLEMYYKRINKCTKSSYDVLKCLCGDDVFKYFNFLDEYSLFINGLLRNNEVATNVASSLILM